MARLRIRIRVAHICVSSPALTPYVSTIEVSVAAPFKKLHDYSSLEVAGELCLIDLVWRSQI